MATSLRPIHVAVVALLQTHLNPRPGDPRPGSPLFRALEDALLREIGSADRPHIPNLVTLLQNIQEGLAAQGSEGEDYFEEVKQALGTALSSLEVPDDLINLLDGVRNLINSCTTEDSHSGQPAADASSTLGLYLRGLYVRYAAMPYEPLCTLLGESQAYFNEAVEALQGGRRRTAPPGAASLQPRLELERLLDGTLAGLDRAAGRLPQAAVEAPLAALEAQAPDLARTFLARHASALAHRDFAASLDYLHRFFNHHADAHALRLGAGDEAGDEAALAAGRARLQGAALSLGSMHAQFGHTEEAMAALNETVRIAQQSSDDTCLAHALACLCHIMDATTPSTITSVGQARGTTAAARHHAQLHQLLHRCLRRAEELRLPHLVAYALLALAKFELLHSQPAAEGGSAGEPPASCSAALHVGAAVRDTGQLHLATTLAAALPTAPAMSSGLASARVLRGAPDLFGAGADVFGPNTAGQQSACAAEVEQLAGSAHLLRAACWDLCGSRRLGQAHLLAYLSAYSDVGRTADQCAALAQLATSVGGSHGHAAAARVLAAADELFPHSQSVALALARLAMEHDRALHRGELQDALALAQQMTGLASPTDTTDITTRLDAEECVVRTLLASGQHEAAVKAAHTLFAVCTEAGQPIHGARLLLLLGQAHHRAGAPMAALPYALSCAAHCRRLSLDLLGAEAALLLAELWCDMRPEGGGVGRGRAEVEAVLPLVLAHGSLDLQSRAQLQLAEALLGGAPSAAALAGEGEWVLELLAAAGAGFRRLEDWRQLARVEYQRALALDALGQVRARNAAAAAHHALLARRCVD